MFSKNSVSLIGNLTKDPETSFTTNNVSVTKFTVVTEHSYKKNDNWDKKASFHNVVAFNLNQFALDYLKKGRKINVDGRIEYNEYEKDGKKTYFTNIVLEKIVLLSYEKPETPAPETKDDLPF